MRTHWARPLCRVLAGVVLSAALLVPGTAAVSATTRASTQSLFGLGLINAVPDSLADGLAPLDTRAPGGVLVVSMSAPNPVLVFEYSGIALGSSLQAQFNGGQQIGFDFNPVVDAIRLAGSNTQ